MREGKEIRLYQVDGRVVRWEDVAGSRGEGEWVVG